MIFQLHLVKSGPALTLKIRTPKVGTVADIDLVPCFVFKINDCPLNGFRANPVPEKVKIVLIPTYLGINSYFISLYNIITAITIKCVGIYLNNSINAGLETVNNRNKE